MSLFLKLTTPLNVREARLFRDDKWAGRCILRALRGFPLQWLGGRVVMQRIANPSTPVRFRPEPPFFNGLNRNDQHV